MERSAQALSGVLIMNKPEGFTSFDVVAKLRGILHTRKIGHGGTLDPLATGVLPVFVGGATKAADYAAAQDKEYVAGFTLGFATDTQDTTGTVLEASGKTATRGAVEAAVRGFLGAQQQVPPMYSAVQIDGQRLYDLARRGISIERPAREICVLEIELLDFCEQTQQGTFRAVCSKGTYVRTLIHDLGLRLGTLAAMHSLRRTRAGAYPLAEAQTFDVVQQAMQNGEISTLLYPTDSLFMEYPAVYLTDEGAQRALRGAVIFPRDAVGCPETEETLCRVYHEKQFLMLGKTRALNIGGIGLFVHKNFR